MSSSITSRFEGFNADVAFKAPVRVVSTSAINLSGLQAIDGITVAANDRVLVTGQSSAIDNGIWVAGSGAWSRAQDFNGTYDVAGGTVIRVNQGTTYANTFWTVSGNGAKVIGTDALTITQALQPFYGLTVFRPEDYGATAGTTAGDITANNAAFAALTAALTAAGGGVVELYPKRTYVVGKQTANSNGIRFEGTDILYGLNLKYFIVRGNGATMKLAPNLYFGGYDSNLTPTATVPNTNSAQRADQGRLLRASGCDLVHIENLFFDGNCANGIVGGPWGDTGRQCVSYGLHLFNNDSVKVINCHAFDWLLDGMAAGFDGQTDSSPAAPMLFQNCSSLRSGRNCFSLVGGNNFTAINCLFSDAGNAVNTTFGRVTSNPASAFDVEAESTVIRRPVFITSTFYSGLYGNTALVTDSGDSRDHYFLRCKFDGNVFINKPGVILDDCEVNGQFGDLYGGATNTKDNTVLRNLRATDVAQSGKALSPAFFMDSGGSGGGIVIEGGYIHLTKSRMIISDYVVNGLIVKISFGTTTFANREYAIIANGTIMRDVVVIDDTGSILSDAPTTNEGYSINVSSATVAQNCVIVPKASYTLKWITWSAGGGGTPSSTVTDARYNNGIGSVFDQFQIHKKPSFGSFYGVMTVRADDASPTVGTMANGSWVYNSNPANGEPLGWSIVGGAAVASGIVGGVQAATVAVPSGGATVDTEARTAIASILTSLKNSKQMAT